MTAWPSRKSPRTGSFEPPSHRKASKTARDPLLGGLAVGLPSQGGSHTDENRHHEAGEGAGGSPAKRRPVSREPVILRLGRAKGRIERRLADLQASENIGPGLIRCTADRLMREPGQRFFGPAPVLRRHGTMLPGSTAATVRRLVPLAGKLL